MKHLIGDMDLFADQKIKLMLDRGFYSARNVNDLLTAHLKFLLGVRVSSLTYVQDVLAEVRDAMRNFGHYDPDHELYLYSRTINWDYTRIRPYKGDALKEERRMYLPLLQPRKGLGR